MVAPGADAEFCTPGSVDDHMVSRAEHGAVRVKKVYFLSRPELDVHHLNRGVRFHGGKGYVFFHWVFSLSLRESRRRANSSYVLSAQDR